jgi:PadR family transcriptional regulator, regulatory protein PadR
MTKEHDMPPGALILLILRVLQSGPLHGYAIARRIYHVSGRTLKVEEGSLYPALRKMLLNGWVSALWGISDASRRIRIYSLTSEGQKQLTKELDRHETISRAIEAILREA